MGSLAGFRPPQFSEDDAWLPSWLQHCNVEKLDVEDFYKDEPTFMQRVEEWQLLRMSISNREFFREEGRFNIGPLFLSGSDCSPFTFGQSPYNVAQFHLRLSLDGISENTTLTDDACQTETYCPIQPLEGSAILGQTAIDLSLINNSDAVNWSHTRELERSVHTNEMLRHEENAKASEDASDAVELCIAASEALVINDLIKSDSFSKSSSASAILEASLQVKQARLEGWANSFSCSTEEIVDDLPDLDDIAMESAYEDAGIYVNELPGNELSVSQVKDTLDSENDIKYEKKVSATNCGKLRGDSSSKGVNNQILLEKYLSAEYSGGDTQMGITDSPAYAPCTDGVGDQNNCFRSVCDQARLGLSFPEENTKVPAAENNSHEPNVCSSPVTSHPDAEKDENVPETIQERFQSRWFGGWMPGNEVKCVDHVSRSIRGPFAAETSFFSESADVAPDENSFAQNHDKEAITASQLTKPSENFCNGAKDGMLLSQDDVKSSSASLVDPLCSVVPCSLSEIACSSPATNHENEVLSGRFNITNEHTKESTLGTSPSNNDFAQGERIKQPISNTKESQLGVCRKFTSLSFYSKQLPSNATFLEKDSRRKRSFFIESNAEFTSWEPPFTNNEETLKGGAQFPVLHKENTSPIPLVLNRRTHKHFRASSSSPHDLAEENPCQTALCESNATCPPRENPQLSLLKCKNQNDQQIPAKKHVHFSEKESSIPDNKELQKMQPGSKTSSARVAKKSTLSSPHLKSRVQQLDRFLRPHLGKERKRLILQSMEFMLTGFSCQKEKEIEGLIRKYGGTVVSQIPSKNLKGKRSSRFKSQALPLILCLKKIQSLKFLYGCAVNAYVLKVNWLIDSIAAGFVLPPKKYMILPRSINRRHAHVYTAVNYDGHSLVFNDVGIMLHGKNKFFTNIATITKHGGGQVFKTLQRLVQALEAGSVSQAVIVADDESRVSRHLKHCALEQNIPLTSIHWIIKSLYAGQPVPLEEKKGSQPSPAMKIYRIQDPAELSQEI